MMNVDEDKKKVREENGTKQEVQMWEEHDEEKNFSSLTIEEH